MATVSPSLPCRSIHARALLPSLPSPLHVTRARRVFPSWASAARFRAEGGAEGLRASERASVCVCVRAPVGEGASEGARGGAGAAAAAAAEGRGAPVNMAARGAGSA